MIIACVAPSLPAQTPLETEIILKHGGIRMDRYSPRQTQIKGEIRSIDTLPNGELSILTEESFITFDGTRWETFPGLLRPTALHHLNEHASLVGHSRGISLIEADDHGKNRITQLGDPNSIADSLHSPRYQALARGHVFGSHGLNLLQITPDGSTQMHQTENWTSSIFAIGDELYATGGTHSLLSRWDWEQNKLIDHDHVLSDSVQEWFVSNTQRANGGVWMLSEHGNIVGFDGIKSWIWPGNETLREFETKVVAYIELAPDQLAIATSSKGVILFDHLGQIKQIISTNRGLDSNTITGIGKDRSDGIWIATKRSLNRISRKPSTYQIDERHGLTDSVNAIEIFNNQVHLATPSGIYAPTPAPQSPDRIFSLKHQIKSVADLLAYDDHLFIAGERIAVVEPSGELRLLSQEGATCLWQPSQHPDIILAGNYHGVQITRRVNGKWSPTQRINGSSKEVFSFAESASGALFGGNGGAHITRIHIKDTQTNAEIIPIDVPTHGIWTAGTAIDGEVYINTQPALLWNEESQSFHPTHKMEYFFGEAPFGFHHVFGAPDEPYRVNTNPRRGTTFLRPNREVIGDIASINDAIDSRASSLLYDQQGRAWIGGEFGLLIALNPNSPVDPVRIRPRIHRITSLRDGSALEIPLAEGGPLYLKPNQNSLRIEVAFPSYQAAKQNQYQIYLEGFDSEWAPYQPVPFRDLTNLPPGNYTLFIYAQNSKGQVSDFSLPMVVATHWYQQPWAYVSFILFGITLIVFIVWGYNRNQIRRSKELKRLVQERTQEIEDQNSILARQAEILETQNEELAEKTKELTATTETLTATLEQLQTTQDQLLDTARTAGKAEIAINVLHNVGNVLNSLNVSINLVVEKVDRSKVSNLSRIAKLLDSRKEDIATFLTQDPKGKSVPEYLIHLSETLNDEIESVQNELVIMGEDIEHIKSIIAAQQTHAKSQSLLEPIDVRDLCETALSMLGNEIIRSNFEIINEIQPGIVIENDKHQLLDIVLNLITNAQDAINEEAPPIGVITLKAERSQDGSTIDLLISDNGSGIDPDTMQKLFRHGFTTKADGHGFGLHSSANTARSSGAILTLESQGKHKGATAKLTLPLQLPKATQNPDTKMAASGDAAN